MGIVIMGYGGNCLKEYYLPPINNSDYSVILEKELYQQNDNTEVLLEVLDGRWYLVRSDAYQIQTETGADAAGQELRGGMRFLLRLKNSYKITLLVFEADELFQLYTKYDISGVDYISIGSDGGNMISYSVETYISQNHAYLYRDNGRWFLEDISSNGTYMDSRRIQGRYMLQFGDCITIFGLRLFFLNDVLAVGRIAGELSVRKELPECILENRKKGRTESRKKKVYFKRSPRIVEHLFDETIDIESPPQKTASKKKPLLMTIGPCFTMAIPMLLGCSMSVFSAISRGSNSGIYMFTGIVTAVSSAAIGTVWALMNLNYTKKEEFEAEELRYNAYGQYLIEKTEYIEQKYNETISLLYRNCISGEECCRYQKYDVNLWNRNQEHEDFLSVRMGIGNLPFQADIHIQPPKFSLLKDDLSEKPQEIQDNFRMLYNVPVCIDLPEKNLIGVIGGAKKQGAYEVIKNIVAQISVQNCYTDVKLGFIYQKNSEEDSKRWEFARWLPHVWMGDKKTRLIAENKNDVGDIGYELSRTLRMREEGETSEKGALPRPYYILIISDMELLEGELLEKYVLNPKPEYGLTTFLLVERYEELPNSCQTIIQNDGKIQGTYELSDGIVHKIAFDYVDTKNLEALSRMLSDITVQENEQGGSVPNQLDFFEMYNIDSLEELHVEERWRKNRTYESLKALIGKKSGGADCYLDIHEKYHGPHGLVAGTTGSGKSETLQTYILSLAVNFSPDDVGFFIIDFKGGGMANLFSNLPHMVGKISNLSGNQVRRAMISIKSENMRRQRLFNEHSVNNINLYTRLYKNGEASIPIPHLFIIIDEFAELKREEPEFMKELISVAQVGRSLGVHLILATQKPSGTVDDNIWSNSKFRLCLRVQDRQDSNDMLHKPDAAYITQAGRGYLQVGNDEIYELFQSGYSGAVFEGNGKGAKSSIATMVTLTGKAALVGNTAKKKKKDAQKKEWLTALMEMMLEAMADISCSQAEAKHMDVLPEKLVDKIYEKLEASRYDYERSSHQIERIKDYLSVWPEGVGTEVTVPQAVEEAVRSADIKDKKLPELKEKTQLEAVIEYLQETAGNNHYRNSIQLWLPILPSELYLEQLGLPEENPGQSGRWNLEAAVGIYDDPENQSQKPLTVSFSENGHYAVCGMVATGKSTFLQTLLYALYQKYTPEELNVYGLDYSSRMLEPFKKAPHTGGIVYDTEEERTKRLFHMLERMMTQRKELLKGGNYAQYVQVHGTVLPAVLIVIDNFAGFKEKTANKYEDTLIRLSREGVGYGMFLMISAAGFSASEIQSRIGDNLRSVIALNMGDKFKYVDVLRTTKIDVLPEADVYGRGLAVVKGRILEYQTALAVQAEDDYKRLAAIEKFCEEKREEWKGPAAVRIPEIPEKPVLSEFAVQEDYLQTAAQTRYLPVGYDVTDASVVSVDLWNTFCYLITGKGRTGKTNYMKILLKAASTKKGEICIIEQERQELKKAAEQVGASYLSAPEEIYMYFKGTIPMFKERNSKKRAYLEAGMDEEEICRKMEEETPIFIFVANLEQFIQTAYKPLEQKGSMYAYLENITEKGSCHGFYFFACLNTENAASMYGKKIYSNMVGYRTGVHLGGNTAQQKVFSFSNIPYAEQNKAMRPGIGLYPSYEDSGTAKKLVIPLAKGAEI